MYVLYIGYIHTYIHTYCTSGIYCVESRSFYCAEISDGDFVNYMYVAVLAVLSATAQTGPPVLTNVLTCLARLFTPYCL